MKLLSIVLNLVFIIFIANFTAVSAMTDDPTRVAEEIMLILSNKDNLLIALCNMTSSFDLQDPREKAQSINKIRRIINWGVDLNTLVNGYTPLMCASFIKDTKLLELFIEFGANLNIQNEGGQTALMLAIIIYNSDPAAILIEKNANLDLQDSNGYTPLMIAILKENYLIAEKIILAGADLTLKNSENNTALSYAKKADATELINLIESRLDLLN